MQPAAAEVVVESLGELDFSSLDVWSMISDRVKGAEVVGLEVDDAELTEVGHFERTGRVFLNARHVDEMFGDMNESVTLPIRLEGDVLPDGRMRLHGVRVRFDS